MNDFLDNLAANQYQKQKDRDTIKELKQIDIFEQTRRRDVIEMRSVANYYLYKISKMRLMEIVREYEKNNYKTTHGVFRVFLF